MTMPNKIDHFAIGADSLEQGTAWLKRLLGVEAPRGGKHGLMSTHNCVCQTGHDSFLEILSIDPDAPEPGRARWFTLDDPKTRARLKQAPRPLCWVVGTDRLDDIVAHSPVDLGEVLSVTRGALSWRLTVPKDGSLPVDGLLPAFIEWPAGPHPSANMANLGIELKSVRLSHPDPAALTAFLNSLDVAHLAAITEAAAPALSFVLQKADGETVTLR